jgi:hypothetical protein
MNPNTHHEQLAGGTARIVDFEDTDDGTVHRPEIVPLGEGDTTTGQSGKETYWDREFLQEATDAGVFDHAKLLRARPGPNPHKPMAEQAAPEEIVGDAGTFHYEEGRGPVSNGDGTLLDDHLAALIEHDLVEISPDMWRELGEYDEEIGAYRPAEILSVPYMTIVDRGAGRKAELSLSDADAEALAALPRFEQLAVPDGIDTTPPQDVQDNAQKALDWREEYGDEVNGGTEVGWRRANQLANGESVSEDVLQRIANFKRHESNSSVSDENQGTPWQDAGRVAWLLWGGDAGVLRWAPSKLTQIENARSESEQNASGSSIHTPDYDGTTRSGEWSRPAKSDFDTDDLSAIDDHFVGSRTGFPPENYGDLAWPVVNTAGTLSLPGLRSAHRTIGATNGFNESDKSRARSTVRRLADDVFDVELGDEGSEQNAASELNASHGPDTSNGPALDHGGDAHTDYAMTDPLRSTELYPLRFAAFGPPFDESRLDDAEMGLNDLTGVRAMRTSSADHPHLVALVDPAAIDLSPSAFNDAIVEALDETPFAVSEEYDWLESIQFDSERLADEQPTADQLADADAISQSTVVSWGSQGDRPAYGKVVATVDEGEMIPASEIEDSSSHDGPAAKIRLYRPDDEGVYRPATNDDGDPFYVAHGVDTLTVHDSFPTSEQNVPTGDHDTQNEPTDATMPADTGPDADTTSDYDTTPTSTPTMTDNDTDTTTKEELREQLAAARHEREEAQERADSLEADKEELREDKQSLEAETDELEAEKESLKENYEEAIDTKDDRIEDLEADTEHARRRYATQAANGNDRVANALVTDKSQSLEDLAEMAIDALNGDGSETPGSTGESGVTDDGGQDDGGTGDEQLSAMERFEQLAATDPDPRGADTGDRSARDGGRSEYTDEQLAAANNLAFEVMDGSDITQASQEQLSAREYVRDHKGVDPASVDSATELKTRVQNGSGEGGEN